MKKTLVSLVLGLAVSSGALADDLATIYELAQANDPIINRAKAQKDAAYAGIAVSRANLLPQISGTLAYSDSTRETLFGPSVVDIDSSTLSADITLSMSLYDHANWLGLDRAELVAQQSDASLGANMQSLMLRTTNAYLAVLREQDSVEFVKAELRAIERQLEQTKQRFNVGLTAITDVHEAQANFDNTVARQIRAENLLELRLEELREITGKYHSRISILDTERFDAAPPTPATADAWMEIAEESNLDLLAQRFARDIAKQDVDITRSGHYPTLGLRLNYGTSDNEQTFNGEKSSPPRLDDSSIGLTLSVPIYQGGSVSANTDRNRANYVVAAENLELTYRQTVRSVRSSFNDVKAAISTIRALQQSVISAESALTATEAGFDVGTRTIVDVLNSTRNVFDARRNLADARYNFITAIVSLKQAAGTLKESDLLDINKVLMPAPVPAS
ncbi:outer membrane channel protein TolC [Glaciecola petra]|uniref:Outer membrane channel protein TolC n=1 Tax=Glaciecola petra TaxID=3075602 RepID=A0ABU2ZLS9_9ALTE|nr:outer membrane channel protein TolC [Aestuariibacter sp. P117]MDT0593361.1 outer membrane channel protein TolC [Aestuariibacter sp. P117]